MKIGKRFNQLSKKEYFHYIDNHQKYTDFNTLGLYSSLTENEKLNLDDKLQILEYANIPFGKTFQFLQLKDPITYFELTTLGQELTKADEHQIWENIRINQEKILKEKQIRHRNIGYYSRHNCGYESCPLNGLMIRQGSQFAEWHMRFAGDKNPHAAKTKADRYKKQRKQQHKIIDEELDEMMEQFFYLQVFIPQKRLSMKYLAIVLAFLTISACSNLTEVKTTVEVKSDTPLSESALESVKNQLQKRFDKSEFRNTNIVTGDQPNHLIITAKVDMESERGMQRYHAMFTSKTLDLWDTYRITDPEVVPFVSALPKISGFAAQNPENSGMLSLPEVLGSCDNESLLGTIIDSLKMLPDQPENVRYLWSTETDERYRGTRGRYELYMIDTRGKNQAPVTDRDIAEASAGKSEYNGETEVYFKFDEAGAQRWAKMTERAAANQNRSIAIVINNRVYSAPRVMSPITGGSCAISGNFTPEEAQELALKIDLGRLDYPLEVVADEVVEK